MTDTSTDTGPLTPREEDEALAAEYVLGVLDLPDRMAAEARLKRDDAFATLVSAWEVRLDGLNDAFDEVAAPDLMPEIEARLFPVAAKAKRGWFGWLAGAATAAALVLAVVVSLPDATQPSVVVAELGSQTDGLIYEARYDGSQLLVSRLAGTRPAGAQDHELWIIAPGSAPVSLGILGDTPLTIDTPRPPAGWVLAVSVEPTGGSPTGAPTGPVILTAEISA